MKKLLGSAAGAALIMVSSLAQANGYIGVNYAQLEQDDRFFGGEDFDTGDVFVRLGGHINEYFAGELRIGTTLESEEDTGAGLEFRHDSVVSALLRLQYKFGAFKPYAVAGMSRIDESLDTNTGSNSSSFNDATFGAGFDFALGEKFGLNVEYLQLSDDAGVKRIGPSVGVFMNFY